MALQNYSAANGSFRLGTLLITEWGGEPGLKVRDLKRRTNIKRGIGGGGAAMDAVTIPKEVTITLLPGSAQARSVIAMMKAKNPLFGAWTQLGSVEHEAFTNGRIVSRGDRDRIAESEASLSDEVFVIEFLNSTET